MFNHDPLGVLQPMGFNSTSYYSLYIRKPPFFAGLTRQPQPIEICNRGRAKYRYSMCCGLVG